MTTVPTGDPCNILNAFSSRSACLLAHPVGLPNSYPLTDPCNILNPIATKTGCMTAEALEHPKASMSILALVGIIIGSIIGFTILLVLLLWLYSLVVPARYNMGGRRKWI